MCGRGERRDAVGERGQLNPLRYASRELDATTGLYYNRARWYDPYLGRFISEDPIGISGGINVYAYAGNDPVNFTDPWGLYPCPGPNCLDPFTVVGRPRGWFRRAWDATLGDRRWGGMREGGGPTSIMGEGTVIGNAEDDTDLLEELIAFWAPAPPNTIGEYTECVRDGIVGEENGLLGLLGTAGGAFIVAGDDLAKRSAAQLQNLYARAQEIARTQGRVDMRPVFQQAGRLSARIGAGTALVTGGKYAAVIGGAGVVGWSIGSAITCTGDVGAYR